MRQFKRWLRKLTVCLLVLALPLVCGCSIGPKVRDEIIFIKHQGVAARVAKPTKAEVLVEKDGKVFRQVIDIGGFYVISPDQKEGQK